MEEVDVGEASACQRDMGVVAVAPEVVAVVTGGHLHLDGGDVKLRQAELLADPVDGAEQTTFQQVPDRSGVEEHSRTTVRRIDRAGIVERDDLALDEAVGVSRRPPNDVGNVSGREEVGEYDNRCGVSPPHRSLVRIQRGLHGGNDAVHVRMVSRRLVRFPSVAGEVRP